MSGLESLLDVQAHDTRADQLRHRLDHLPERDALAQRRAALEAVVGSEVAATEQRNGLIREQKRLEDEIAALDAKTVEVDRTLYSGAVNAPRELQALQDELGALARRKGQLEDQELEIWERLEPVDAELARLTGERASHETALADIGAALAAAEQGAGDELTEVVAARATAAEPVPADLLGTYEKLRRSLGGVGVARLTGTTCGGCHLGLSAVEVDRIRSEPPDSLVFCEECSRILVH
ncbi:N/A [soil metagenome]